MLAFFMTMKNSDILTLAHSFLAKAFGVLDQKNISLEKHWHIDHLCYRTQTQVEYEEVKRDFLSFSTLLIESEVNTRLISTFKLETPIVFGEWEIDLIEVPAPKSGKITPRGFEHFEIVCDVEFDEIKKRYPHGSFSDKGLVKDFNQELELAFDDFAIKFHYLSLESVVNVEKNPLVFNSLEELGILKTLKDFNPLVAGTFPLGLNTTDSDIDILIKVADFKEMKSILDREFSNCSDYKYSEEVIKGELSLVCSFIHHSIAYEVFGQKIHPLKQDGYRHFLIEERLLKNRDHSFFEKIKTLRLSGVKTEPAFAEVLDLHGNPYQALLDIQKKSNRELRELLIKKLF